MTDTKQSTEENDVIQTDKLFYIVCDQKEAELRGMTPEVLGYMVENGLVYSGDTIAELAENMGVPADALCFGKIAGAKGAVFAYKSRISLKSCKIGSHRI